MTSLEEMAFCNYCKHLSMDVGKQKCESPHNSKLGEHAEHPSVINEDNDCKWYERK